MNRRQPVLIITLLLLLSAACTPARNDNAVPVYADGAAYFDPEEDSTISRGSRDNTSDCLTPSAPGTIVYSSDHASLDLSNASQGYLCAEYYGDCRKVKLQITGPNEVTYTYNLHGEKEFFPLSAGSGSYAIGIYENVISNQYAVNLYETMELSITDEFGPFLYPNQYCMFDQDTRTVLKAEVLAYSADSDLDVVSSIYNFVIRTISYDYKKAETVESGYVSDVDDILSSRLGICLDYAAVMTCMLRSQGIPTRLEVGYAGTAYHAWISTYIGDAGWVNGIIRFDGKSWSLMDPTLSAGTDEEKLMDFIGDGSNYILKYVY